jgi:hypothetical protein
MQQLADSDTKSCLSINRIQAVAAFYYSLVRWQIVLYPCVAALMYVVSALLSRISVVNVLSGAPSMIVDYMFYLAPLVLTRRDCRMVETLLPATALEKTIVIACYFFILVPIMTYGVYYALEGLVGLIIPGIVIAHASLSDVGDICYTNIMQVCCAMVSLVPAVTCFLTVMKAKRNRALKGIIFPVLAMIALGVIAGISAVIYVYVCRSDFFDVGADGLDGVALVNNMLSIWSTVGILSFCYAVLGIVWTYRILKNRQIV